MTLPSHKNLFVVMLSLLISLSAVHSMPTQFTFEKIVDENTTVPGKIGTFNKFSNAILKKGKIAFIGTGLQYKYNKGIYIYKDGKIRSIIDSTNSTLLKDEYYSKGSYGNLL